METGTKQRHEIKELNASSSLKEPPMTGPAPEDLKLVRRHSRRAGLFDRKLLKAAFKQSLVMFRPDIQWKNPVMFVVEVGTALTLLYTVANGGKPARRTRSLRDRERPFPRPKSSSWSAATAAGPGCSTPSY